MLTVTKKGLRISIKTVFSGPLHPYIEVAGCLPIKGWSSDFAPLRGAFSSIRQWLACFRAITELTAAGQSGIHTPFPINRG